MRWVLRWAAIPALALVFAGSLFAASLPFLVDANAIRGALIESLSAWRGSPVSIAGPIRIASFAGLSIEASGVDLNARPQQGAVQFAHAKSVKAVLRLSSLFSGKLEFKNFIIESPHVVFRRGFSEPLRASFGIEAAHLVLTLAAESPFANIDLIEPVFFFAESARGPFQRVALNRVRLRKGPTSSVSTGVLVANASGAANAWYALDIASPGFGASFRGQCAGACQTAFGTLRLSAALDGGRTSTLAALAPWERPSAFTLSSELTLSKRRAALDNASLSFGDHAAKGSLALDITTARPRLEGTIAYDTLDVSAVLAANKPPAGEASLAALPLLRQDAARPLDFDLRVSADRFQAGSFETGPLALALTRVQNRLSIDVASVALFGGRAAARLDVNPEDRAALSFRGTATQLNAGALSSAFELPVGVSGAIALQAALTTPLDDLSAADGTFSIRFPLGGSIEGDLAQTLYAALDQDLGWGLRGRSFPFATAMIDGIAKPGRVDLVVQGQSGEKSVGGALKIAFPGAIVSGTLLASDASKTGGEDEPSPPARTKNVTTLFLSGAADAIIVSASGKPSLSN